MHGAYKQKRRQVNKKILQIKERRAYRDCIKRKGDKIGMSYVVCTHVGCTESPPGHETFPISLPR